MNVHEKINDRQLAQEMQDFDYSVLFDEEAPKSRRSFFTFQSMYQKYFTLNIHQRINERQKRNGLNINYLFATVLRQEEYTGFNSLHPVVNNGMYHHIGKNHSQYPGNNYNSYRKEFMPPPDPYFFTNIKDALAELRPSDKVVEVINNKFAITQSIYDDGTYEKHERLSLLDNNQVYWFGHVKQIRLIANMRITFISRPTYYNPMIRNKKKAKLFRRAYASVRKIK
jgi:hypothetical protein